MPVVEIYSKWGCSLHKDHLKGLWRGVGPGSGYTHDMMARGYRCGFIASSDCHNTAPHGEMAHLNYGSGAHNFHEHGGLAGVWAAQKTREAIHAAIKARNCFAASYERILMDMTVNDLPMGSVAPAAGAERARTIRATILGTNPGHDVEIVRNGEVIHSLRIPQETQYLHHVEFEDTIPLGETFITPPESSGRPPFTYYYVRTRQPADGCMAWSTPIWLTQS